MLIACDCWGIFKALLARNCNINLWLLDRYDRLGFDLSGNVSITVNKAKEYLADNQPGPAALVLDALTVVLLPADNERCINDELLRNAILNVSLTVVIFMTVLTLILESFMAEEVKSGYWEHDSQISETVNVTCNVYNAVKFVYLVDYHDTFLLATSIDMATCTYIVHVHAHV